MPYKSEKIKIEHTKHDRRIKLTPEDKEDIKELTGMSIRGIARLYGVDKRLIQFILFPERYEKNKRLRKERGGSKIYYDRTKNTITQRKHRRHKQNLFVSGEIS